MLQVAAQCLLVQEECRVRPPYGLAGLAEGVWGSRKDLADHWQLDREFTPGNIEQAEQRYERWKEAVGRSRGWSAP